MCAQALVVETMLVLRIEQPRQSYSCKLRKLELQLTFDGFKVKCGSPPCL